MVAGRQLISRTKRADARAENLRIRPHRSRVDRRAAVRAECLLAFVSALSGLDVDLRYARKKPKRALNGRHHRAEGGARQSLAIGAVANHDLSWIDLGLEPDRLAVTTAGNFHGPSLSTPTA